VKELRASETYKNITKMLFSFFSNNVDFKNNNKNYRTTFWIFRMRD